MKNDWQPIDTAPKDGSEVLLFQPSSREVFCAFWANGGWRTATVKIGSFTYEIECDSPSHWMPTPAAPAGE